MIDATGFNIFWTMGGIILGIVSHLMMAGSLPCQTLSPYLVGVVYSFSYNIIGSAVRAIPVMIIKDNQLSTAYGFFHSAFNLALSVIALTSGVIIDYSGYFAVEIFFSFCLGVAFLLALVLPSMNPLPQISTSTCFVGNISRTRILCFSEGLYSESESFR